MSDYLDPNNEELLKDFFMEAQAMVDALEQNILVLENDPRNKDAIDEIFRAAHTLKGASATVQMTELAGFTHLMEDVLDEIRSDKVSVSGDVVDTLLKSIDIIKEILQCRGKGIEYSGDLSGITESLSSLLEGSEKPVTKTPLKSSVIGKQDKPVNKPVVLDDELGGLSEYELLELKEAAGEAERIYRVSVFFNEDNPMNTVGGIQVFAALKNLGKILKTHPDFEALYEDKYYPQVDYFITTQKDAAEIPEKISLSDVTTGVEVAEIASSAPGKIKKSEASAMAAAAPPEAAKKAKPEEKPKQEPVKAKEAAAVPEPDEKVKEPESTKNAGMGSVLRVDSKRIDNLLNLVSEAVINKATFNQISTKFNETQIELQNTDLKLKERLKELFDSLPDYLEDIQKGRSLKEIKKEMGDKYTDIYALLDPFQIQLKNAVTKFRSTSQNLGRITTELHERVLQIRMVPISQIFSRFPRLVRDVSKSLNKQIKLVIEGEETELDKSVIEDLLDPLIHCVRNSVDHGIEGPEDREKSGKPAEGLVLLKARNEGNMIIIEVSDDGKGIDVDKVREKAIERGVIHPTKNLSDLEAFNLIFEPGFSTAKSVTNISGRGVGLDVVRKQIEKLNGNVSVWSEQGKGTKLTIKIPLTLAIIQGLLVKVGKEIYAIPIASVIDSHRIKPQEIKLIDNYEVYNVRNDVVSLIRLNRLFRIPSEDRKDYNFIVIVGSGDKKMGLMVDSLIGEEDVVIKPLKDKYTNSPGIAGATILGDGTVSLIIDVSQLLDLGLKREMEDRKKRAAEIL